VGWCRLDLYLLYGEDIADTFLGSYQTASKSALPDVLLWDLWAVARSHEHVESWVPNYGDLGRADLTAGELRKRHSAWTHHLVNSIGKSLDLRRRLDAQSDPIDKRGSTISLGSRAIMPGNGPDLATSPVQSDRG